VLGKIRTQKLLNAIIGVQTIPFNEVEIIANREEILATVQIDQELTQTEFLISHKVYTGTDKTLQATYCALFVKHALLAMPKTCYIELWRRKPDEPPILILKDKKLWQKCAVIAPQATN